MLVILLGSYSGMRMNPKDMSVVSGVFGAERSGHPFAQIRVHPRSVVPVPPSVGIPSNDGTDSLPRAQSRGRTCRAPVFYSFTGFDGSNASPIRLNQNRSNLIKPIFTATDHEP